MAHERGQQSDLLRGKFSRMIEHEQFRARQCVAIERFRRDALDARSTLAAAAGSRGSWRASAFEKMARYGRGRWAIRA